MKKTILIALSSVMISATANALSVGVEYKKLQTDYDLNNLDQELSGFGIILSGDASLGSRGWFSAESLTGDNSDIDVIEIAVGMQKHIPLAKNFNLLAGIGIGYGWVDVEGFSNTNNIFTVPIGIELAYGVKKTSLYTGFSYKLIYDITDPTTCNDGSTSNSVGRGTCSYHGGIARYNDEIGDGNGMEYKIGLRHAF